MTNKRPTQKKADFVQMAADLNYTGPVQMLRDLYVKQGMSVTEIAHTLDVPRSRIYSGLVENNIQRRGFQPYTAQRPAPRFPTDRELSEKGVEQCAAEYGVSASAIWHRLRRAGRTMEDVRKTHQKGTRRPAATSRE